MHNVLVRVLRTKNNDGKDHPFKSNDWSKLIARHTHFTTRQGLLDHLSLFFCWRFWYKMTADPARVRLGRIRCLTNTVESMKKGNPLPRPICFVPKKVVFELSEAKDSLKVFEERKSDSKLIEKLSDGKFTCTGLPIFTNEGGWMKIVTPYEGWVLIQPSKWGIKGKLKHVSETSSSSKKSSDVPTIWLKMVERMCSLQIVKNQQISNCDEEEMTLLQTPPPGWNLEADEELAQYLTKYLKISDMGSAGKGGEHFSKVEVSSEEDGVNDMLDPDFEEKYWESDGSQGEHWVRFHMKPGTLVEKFILHVDPDDGSYLPRRVVIKAGSIGDLVNIGSKNFGLRDYEKKDLHLLTTPLSVCYPVIEVWIKSCNQGKKSNVCMHVVSTCVYVSYFHFLQVVLTQGFVA